MRGLAVGAIASASGACYTYAPRASTASPSAGTHVSLVLSDQGRVNLGDRLGTGVDRVEGTIVGPDADGGYVVSVSDVRTIDHHTSHWAGEHVTIAKSDVAITQERQFSRGRTAAVVGGAAVAVAILAGTNTFKNLGIIGGRPDPEPPPSGSFRPR